MQMLPVPEKKEMADYIPETLSGKMDNKLFPHRQTPTNSQIRVKQMHFLKMGMMTNDGLQMRITWICSQDATVQSQMGLLTDRICSETLTSFHHCSPSQRTDPSQAVPPQTWSAPSTDVRHDTEGESLDTCYSII